MSSSEATPMKNITGDSNKKVMEQPYPFITVSPVQSTCKICNKTFNTNRSCLREHMQVNHSHEYSFPRWNGISEILSTKEQEAKLDWKSFVKPPFEFENRPKCNGCNKLFSRPDHFQRHLNEASSDGCKKEHKTMVRCVLLSCGGWYAIPPDDPLYHPTSTTPSASSSILPPCSLDLSARMPKGSDIKLSEYAIKLQPFIKPKYTAKSWPKV